MEKKRYDDEYLEVGEGLLIYVAAVVIVLSIIWIIWWVA